ncbi:hypothetical protein [Streptomyces malaysiensis]|uniref:Uncharacterized protein n=1 Tax=Streptomyces malaysiensis subsp. samsunensis TaxID=459658 RepID=A0A9X2LXZ7_STRMQ|nr:hypothetical protein [Streptomyces samsunensis]MCQ8831812.1 hypothetical protein [Streptomyces samsunensis]
MAFRRITCVIAVCDIHDCGNTRDHDGGQPHFDTEAEALDFALGDQAELPDTWYQRPTGQLVCWRRDPLHDWAREQDGKIRPGPDAMSVTFD